jgi:hypothetical protein
MPVNFVAFSNEGVGAAVPKMFWPPPNRVLESGLGYNVDLEVLRKPQVKSPRIRRTDELRNIDRNFFARSSVGERRNGKLIESVPHVPLRCSEQTNHNNTMRAIDLLYTAIEAL